MRMSRERARRHNGSTIAESALVLSMFLLFLFGIFEYGRFVFLTQVATNAARAGARYASINTDKPSTFVTTDYVAPITGLTTISIKNYVITQMGGANTMMTGFDVQAFPCDPVKIYLDPPQVVPLATATAWNANSATDPVSFPDRIGVRVVGTYQPILPVFVFFYSSTGTIPLTVTACSSVEG